jgi:hypothetical protein
LKDLEQFWLSCTHRFWESSDYARLGLGTYSIDESVNICSNFLHFQFDGIHEAKCGFLKTLSELLNRETQKKNCIEIVSLLSAEKYCFFNPLLIFMGCHRQIMNAKKNNRFPLNNCFNKRVLHFNEPNFWIPERAII